MKDRGLLAHLKDNWHIYAFLVYTVGAWSAFAARLSGAEASIADLQDSDKDSKIILQQLNTRLSNIDVNVAQIQTSIEWLKKAK